LYVRHPEVLWRRTLERVVVLAPGDTEPRMLEPPGDVIWDLLATPSSVDGLVTELVETFAAPADVVRPDVERFLDELVGAGLARRVESS
jgi:hypothetical protein